MLKLGKSKRAIAMAAATVALAGGAAVSSTGTASAATDQYCQHGTCISGSNYNGSALGEICNDQSSANDFYLWLTDDANGHTVRITTPKLSPGQCDLMAMNVGNDPVQVFASSAGNWTYGTNPINPN
ncbi:hypothetical protein [Streptacidiphilus carbonis]|uniref:hypothetical protein n=1 Tax=Streptacidiphilus carbonis TaxID=105422 RepID=UPI0005A8B08E|nr:hypothetical protein [Streptacidiphilus carbonis]